MFHRPRYHVPACIDCFALLHARLYDRSTLLRCEGAPACGTEVLSPTPAREKLRWAPFLRDDAHGACRGCGEKDSESLLGPRGFIIFIIIIIINVTININIFHHG